MSRPEREGLVYFSLDVKMSEEISLIEAKFGVAGFGIVIKLYQIIYDHGYYITWTERELLLYSNRINADVNLINDVIIECLKWEVFNQDLYNQYHILTSRGIQKRYIEATQRRKTVDFISQFLLINIDKKYNDRVNVSITEINVNINLKNVDISTQSKVKQSKVKQSNKIIIALPLNEIDKINEIIEYLNKKAKTKYRVKTLSTRKHISSRLSDGYSIDDFKLVIDKKCNEWIGTEWEKYIRPETLFIPSNFESYLNQKITSRNKGAAQTENYEMRDIDEELLESCYKNPKEKGE